MFYLLKMAIGFILCGSVLVGIMIIYLFRILIKNQRECKSLHSRHYIIVCLLLFVVLFFELLCLGYFLYESFNYLYLDVSPVHIVHVDPMVNAPADLPEDERVRLQKKQLKAELPNEAEEREREMVYVLTFSFLISIYIVTLYMGLPPADKVYYDYFHNALLPTINLVNDIYIHWTVPYIDTGGIELDPAIEPKKAIPDSFIDWIRPLRPPVELSSSSSSDSE